MTYLELRLKLKLEQIKRVEQHTNGKRNIAGGVWNYETVRIHHIAQSLFRGKSFEQIEYKWKQPDNPQHNYIKTKAVALYAEYMKMVTDEKALYIGA